MSYLSAQLTIIALPIISLYFFLFNFAKKQMKKNSMILNDSNIEYNSGIQDILHRYSLIQIFNTQNNEKEKFIDSYERMVNVRSKTERINNLLTHSTAMFEIISLFVMGFIIGNFLLLGMPAGIGVGIVFIVLFKKFLESTNNFINTFTKRELIMGVIEKNFDAEFSTEAVAKKGTKKFSNLNDSIQIKDLSFKYDNNKVIFNKLNSAIMAHKINFIIGKNGSGKTTLVSMLMRLKRPPKNSIFIDGTDILEFDLNSLRGKISYVSQDVKFFYGTIRENISYGNICSDEILLETLDKVGLRDSIDGLPDGLNTFMTDDGQNFSGGQRQRFAIAQSILNDSDIIIFDEATKSVDHDNENAIMNMLIKQFSNKTRIVISHNKNHIRFAEHVIDLDLID